VRNLTVLVFIVSAAIGIFIAVWDYIFTLVIQLVTPGAA
jgi:preprotein translocase subunit SecE